MSEENVTLDDASESLKRVTDINKDEMSSEEYTKKMREEFGKFEDVMEKLKVKYGD